MVSGLQQQKEEEKKQVRTSFPKYSLRFSPCHLPQRRRAVARSERGRSLVKCSKVSKTLDASQELSGVSLTVSHRVILGQVMQIAILHAQQVIDLSAIDSFSF